jgi:hypothetical protein
LNSRAVQEWVTAQDQVFDNCDGKAKLIPLAATPDLPAAIQDDRRYQIASALFYSGSYQEAHDAFTAISRDANSA